MELAGVRRQLTEAREALAESAAQAEAGAYDPAYRAALRSRNLLFHAARGLAAAKGRPLPEMPVVGIPGGGRGDHLAALDALDRALAIGEHEQMDAPVEEARLPYARYLGWLRDEVGKALGRNP
jgi:hypothetical protein